MFRSGFALQKLYNVLLLLATIWRAVKYNRYTRISLLCRWKSWMCMLYKWNCQINKQSMNSKLVRCAFDAPKSSLWSLYQSRSPIHYMHFLSDFYIWIACSEIVKIFQNMMDDDLFFMELYPSAICRMECFVFKNWVNGSLQTPD